MPRRLTGVLICLLVSVVGWAQGESALLRTDEFRIKVELAKALGIDTLTAFKMQWEHCRKQLDLSVRERKSWESVAHHSEWVCLTVLTRRLPQQMSSHREEEEKKRMDSLYLAIQQGTDFELLAEEYSNGALQGKTTWIPMAYLLKEWNACIASLPPNRVSRPFLSPLGIHMLRWSARGFRENVDGDKSFSLQVTEGELFEALLVASLEKKYRKPVEYTEKDLEKWFKEHQEEYKWEFPHYRGVVVHCRDKKEAQRIRKSLKKMNFGEWKVLARSAQSQNVQMTAGLFRIGTNPYVDNKVFKCGNYEPLKDFPYTFVMGKILKKGPQGYTDVYEEVVKDYVEAHKDDWLNVLKGG